MSQPHHNGKGHVDVRRQAAQYLQRLDDARTFVRYAESALEEAMQLAPDRAATQEAVRLRNEASGLRRMLQQFKIKGSGRFNPKRTQRRVVISE